MRQFAALRFILLVSFNTWFIPTQAQLIFTRAGGNSGNGDYFPATEAAFGEPVALALDANNNLFIADRWHNRIRRVDAITHITTTAAGKGLPGIFSGDGGPATEAGFELPLGVVFDRSGNLYISDEHSYRIRKVDAGTGIITTIAGVGTEGYSGDGGPALSAAIGIPRALALDSSDNLYFIDRTNNRVRKITTATGIITTVAGNGLASYGGDGGPATAASFEGLLGIAVDKSGNIYVGDVSNRVRKINAATGIITTVAGNGEWEYAGDGGPATGASIGFDKIVGYATLALDQSDNLYIADLHNSRIRKVSATTGLITTIAGNGAFGYSGDGGLATETALGNISSISLDNKGNLYITDQYRGTVRRIDASTGVITTYAGNGKTYYLGDGKKAADIAIGPYKLALGSNGDLFVAEPNGNRVRRIEAATTITTTVAGRGDVIEPSGDGGPAIAASVDLPEGVAIDKEGNLFVTDHQRRIRKVSAATGIITHFAGDSTQMGYTGDGGPVSAATFNSPADLTFDANGNLFIADAGNHVIRRIDALTRIVTTVAGTGLFGFSDDGDLATKTALTWPTGVAVDKAGNLFIAESYNHCIRKVDVLTGLISTVAGTGQKGYGGDGGPATDAQLFTPGDVTLDKEGNLYIMDLDNQRIRKVDAGTGIISTIAGNGVAAFSGDGSPANLASLNYATDVAIDGDGVIYIADSYNYCIRMICPKTILPSVTTAGVNRLSPDKNNAAVFAENCSLQAMLLPSGTRPVSGLVNDTVWIEPSVPSVNGQPYVPRHYGITPLLNASTATGTLTLYFTQADFTAYNSAPNHGPDLPLDATDAKNNKANVRIKKRSGTSRDGTGRFEAYSGTTTEIVPTAVAWDTTLNAWGATFEVSGFSGFFVTSTSSTLPVTLVNFSAHLQNGDGLIDWISANEQRLTTFEVERSEDGNRFEIIGSLPAVNRLSAVYSFVDQNIATLARRGLYYRLKMVEDNGGYRYSRTVRLDTKDAAATVLLSPNPVGDAATLLLTATQRENLFYQVMDGSGRIILSKTVAVMKGVNRIPLSFSHLTKGFYTLSIREATGIRQVKFVKQ